MKTFVKSLNMKNSVIFSIIFVVSLLWLNSCKKDAIPPSLNMVLYDKPLDTIRRYVQGKWVLKRVAGGFAYNPNWPIKNNPYLIIDDKDRIVIGNDLGVNVDTTIVWRRDRDIFNDSTYLLSYRAQKYSAFPIYYIVDRIENNQIILIDNANDGFYRYYSKKTF